MSDDSNNPKEDELSSGDRVSILDGIPEPDEGDALLDQLFGVTTESDDDDDVVTHSERPSAASLLAASESVGSEESTERQAVVFLEEDNSVRTAMVRALTNLAGVDAFGVDTFDALVAAAKVRPPRLFIANIDMNECSGIELLGKLDELDLEVPIVFGTNTPGAAVGPQLAEYGIYVLDRPIQFHELKERVDSALGGAHAQYLRGSSCEGPRGHKAWL